MTFREEFRLKNFGFSGVALERFYTSQWRLPGIAFVLYRIAVAAYTLVVLVITANDQFNHHSNGLQHWGAYLTNWTYTLLTLHHVFHALVVICGYTLCRVQRRDLCGRPEIDEHIALFHEFQGGRDELGSESTEVTHLSSDVTFFEAPTRWHIRIVWILLDSASTASFMVSLVFWAILVPTSKDGSDMATLNHDNLQLHLVNSILIILEHCFTAVPVRLLHVIYPFIYGLIYMLFSLFYWIPDHSHVMYDILDWGKTETAGYLFLVGLVVIPLLHFCLYLIYRLRIKIFSCVYDL